MTLLYIAIGGAIGSVARFLIQSFVGHYAGKEFPYGTMLVNISGSILMGILIGWLARATPAQGHNIQLFAAVGILGGFTTFSTFSLEAVNLMDEGKLLAMGIYIFASVVVSLMGLFGGLYIMRALP